MNRIEWNHVGLLALLAASAMPAVAGGRQDQPSASAAPTAAQDLRVVRDKQSGRLRAPTADDAKEMDAAAPAAIAPADLVVKVAPDGTRSVQLTEEYMINLDAIVGTNGEVVSGHGEVLHADPVNLPEEK